MRKMTYADIMRISLEESTTRLCDDESRLRRAIPATSHQSAKTTGTVIDGRFEMFPNKYGQMVFVGEEGQYIKK